MSLMPSFSIVGYASIAALVIGFSTGYFISSTVKNKEIAEIKLVQSEEVKKQYQLALTDLQTSSKIIHDNAVAAQKEFAEYLSLKPTKQEFKNATKIALPAGCKPDDARLSYIARATAAANKAATGSQSR